MSERSLKSRTSSKSDTSEVRRKLLEAQANLAKVQLKARLEAEERAAKKKAEADELAAQRDAEDRAARGLADAALLEAELEVQRQQLEYEIRSEAGESQCGSEVSSHAGSVRVPSVKAVETEHESRINQWRLSVAHHHENDPSAMRTLDPVEHTRGPECHSTPMEVHSRPLDPTSTPFAPRHATFEPSVTNPLSNNSQVLKALECTLASSNELARTTLLPPTKLERFGGDFTKFNWFKMSFKWHIENNTSDPERRLNHLYHILDGPPRNLVEHCLHLSPTIGYDEAWKQLSEFYGREVDATEAFIRQLLEWKEIPAGDSEGLMNYASYLKKVKAALGANYTRIELQETMRKIVEKLPHPLRVRWVSKYLEHEHKLPALITFVERQALVAKELKYYECDRRPSKGKPEDTSKPIKAKALPVHHSSPSDNGIYCVYCKKNKHGIQSCHRFQSLNLDDRWNAVVDAKLCFRCLNVAHNHEACEEESTCGKCGLGTHHTLLHYVKKTPPRDSANSKRATVSKTSDKPKAEAGTTSNAPPDRTNTETAPEAGTPATTGHVHAMSTDRRPDGRTMLKLIPVMVNGTCTTVGFIDGGAAPTLAARSLIDRLGVTGRPCNQTMVTEAGTFACKEVVQLTLGNINGGEEEERVKEVFVTDKINVSTDYIMPSDWLKRWPHMADVELQSLPTDHEQVELVIGLDTTLNRVILEQRHGTANEPSAYLTKLGWVAFGPTGDRSASEVSPVHHVHRKFDPQDLTELLQSHFNRDFFEKESLSRLEDSLEDKRFLATLNNTTQHRHGKYVAKLPFKDSTPLPDNMNMAIRRARSLKRRLDNDEAYKTSYVAQMEKYTDKGYAERVPVSQLDRKDGRVWLMPHHSVRHPVKQKDRVVFDLKARHRGTSLNEHLMQGPDLTNSLTGVLLRFREGQHAITADVQEMFHQVKVPEEDRDCLRYLWWPEGVTSKELQVFRMTSHVFGARSSPSVVNFCLRKTALDFGSMYNEEASNSIRRNFYVDNLLKAMDDEEECIKLTRDLINLCRDGGFRLNQWTSSSKQILAAIPREERDDSVAVLDLNKDELPTERALGIHWNMSIDVFTFRIVLKDKPFNRRGVLSVVASIYDPLGYLSPVTLIAKILLQEMCRRKLSWDEEMSADELVRWKTWLAQLPQLEEFQLRRSFIPPDFGDVDTLQLHHFADASQTGYGVVSYLRVVGVNGKIHCTLVIGRARVAPLKRTTIPRLELTAAAIAAQMDSKLKTELDLKLAPSVFWTDSTSVLKYLRNPTARYQTFVDNRVNLIRDTSDIMAWRYINTTANPADLASRGLSVADFLQSSLWFSGPDFLKMDETHWPTMPEDVVRGELDPDAEVKTSPVFDITKKEPTFIESIATRFSSWLKFVRTVAWMTRFIRHMQKARPYSGDSLSSAELRTAENLIWRLTQSQEYEEELSTLSKKGRSLKRSSKLIKLRPFLEDGLLHVGGRLQKSTLADTAKHPIILPSSSLAVKLMVRATHESCGHCGQNHLMTQLRTNYWIVRRNAIVKTVIRECLVCRRLSRRPLVQVMAELPSDRLCPDEPPFTNTGSDCFGPFLVKQGRSTVKRWGAIFTCLTSRAVHLEVIDTMEQDSFVNAIRRFVARRGPIKRMWSDNGTNIVATERELREALQRFNEGEIRDTLSIRGIEWNFHPPHASHFGGVWERLIRSVRRALTAACLQQVTTDETLRTLFCEVEAVVNSRPLTKINDDPNCPAPLTPNMILTLKGSPDPFTSTCKKDMYVKRRWRQAQFLADEFWRRWIQEYLPLLQERQKWSVPKRDINVGDVVLTLDERLPRGSWPLGKVMEVTRSADGRVRQALIKTENGEFRRPVQKLCLLLENDKGDDIK